MGVQVPPPTPNRESVPAPRRSSAEEDRLFVDWAVTFDVDGASALTVKVRTTGDTDGELRERPTGFVLTGAPDVGGSVDQVTVLCENLACASYRVTAQVIALDPLTVSVRSVRS